MAGACVQNGPGSNPKAALRWTSVKGKRKQGRRRTVMSELKEMNLTWGEAAQDGSRWRQIVEASCPTCDVEDK